MRHDAAVICGIGSWLPPTVVTNNDLCSRLDTTDEWIRNRTGIVTRHVATPDLATSDLAVEAGGRAVKSAGGGDIQAVVLATTTPNRPCPATAPEVASRLGFSGVAAFDVSAVCTGFLYGLAASAGLIATHTAERVLLVAAETFSRLLDPGDRSTAPVFGDGAGAIVLRRGEANEPGAIGPVLLGSDGDLRDLISVDSESDRPQYFQMRGREVFRHAVERMGEATLTAIGVAGWRIEEVDKLVAHQANSRILATLAMTLGLPKGRVAANISQVGNTSAASIPLLLAQATRDGSLSPGHRVVLTAFGGGVTWGATTVRWPELEIAK